MFASCGTIRNAGFF